MMDPVTGPIPRLLFKGLVGAAHGQALKAIRQFDPLFGREPGEKIKWQVTAECRVRGYATIEATSQNEANRLARDLLDAEFSWDEPLELAVDTISVEPLP